MNTFISQRILSKNSTTKPKEKEATIQIDNYNLEKTELVHI